MAPPAPKQQYQGEDTIITSPDAILPPEGPLYEPSTSPSLARSFSTPISRAGEADSRGQQQQQQQRQRWLPRRTATSHEGKGQAHDPLMDTIYLGIGEGEREGEGEGESAEARPAISESPSADDTNIYEVAYQAEIERIRREKGRHATIYLTRRVEMVREHLREHVRDISKSATVSGGEQTSVIESAARKARELAESKGLI